MEELKGTGVQPIGDQDLFTMDWFLRLFIEK